MDSAKKIRMFEAPINYLLWTLLALVALRFLTLGHLPYLDASEGRYAVVAKLMLEKGNAFTPEVYQNGVITPFWSKPPFHFWLGAVSFRLFGVNEMAARLPSFLSALVMLTLTGFCGSVIFGKKTAIVSMLILMTSGLFFFIAGSTLVDMTLSAAVTGVMTSFLLATREEAKCRKELWRILFFIFLAIGVLTKGPIAILIPGVSISLWLCLSKDMSPLKQLPWIRGTVIFLLITAPVFLIQEYFTPGFIKYFFLNENLLRYLVKDYGDRFGSGHRYPYGASWLFLLLGFMPWTLLLFPIALYATQKHKIKSPIFLYLFCWAIGPALFLTFARQLLGTYLLPAFGGLSLLVGSIIVDPSLNASRWRLYFRVISLILAVASLGTMAWTIGEEFTLVHLVTSVAVIAFLFFLILCLKAEVSLPRTLAMFSLIIGTAYTSQVLTLCRYFENHGSTFSLVKEVERQYSSLHPSLYFPFGVPFSAYLYGNQELIDGANGHILRLKNENQLIVLREKQRKDFTERFGTKFKEVLSVGKWQVLHLENHEGLCQDAMLESHKSSMKHVRHDPDQQEEMFSRVGGKRVAG